MTATRPTKKTKTKSRRPPSSLEREKRDLFRELAARMPDMSNEELASLLTDLKPMRVERTTAEEEANKVTRQQTTRSPKTDDELWHLIKEQTGYEIPRVAVCHDHCAPFDPIADAYFNRESAILIMASREGGKTIGIAVLHFINAETKPGIEGITFGAIKRQAEQGYKYVKSFVYTRDADGNRIPKPQIDGDPTREKTEWKSGSLIQVIVGTKSGVNSPHPQTVHADEVDLMEEEVFAESQPVDTVIPTPDGPRRFGDLELGDSVFGSYGEPTSVTKVHELGEREVFRVELTDGRATECCADHLWMAGYVSSYGRRAWQVRRLRDLKDVSKPDPRGGNAYRWAIPQQPIVKYESLIERGRGLMLHPYVLGVLLGDGCIKRRLVQFRANDQEIVETVRAHLPKGIGVYATRQDPPIYRITRGPSGKSAKTPNPIVEELERLGLEGCDSHTKFIPRDYLEASPENRLMLLRGLMDTDGSYTKDPYFASVSEQLAKDVRELVLSLGGRALLRKKNTSTSSFANCGYIYEVSASLPLGTNPFWIQRKASKVNPRQRTLMPSIRSVTSVGVKQVRCISVENSDGIYLTNDFIVTHNSRNMSSSKNLPNGVRYAAIDIVTSTRKSSRGPMQRMLDEVDEAKKNGHRPAWKVYAFCFKEAAAEVPCCRVVDPVLRVRRLLTLGRSPNELCECDKIVKGEWDENNPRTLESVCRGDLFNSRGWMHYDDISRKFTQNSQAVWEAQMECRRPMADGLYLPTFSRPRHCVRGWVPRPQYGRISMGVDWGGSAASVVLWVQGPLLHPVEVVGFTMKPLTIPQGAYVVFDQFYWAERIGATRMADEVVAKEIAYRQLYLGWRVRGRFADMAGAQQRNDWHEHSPPLRTQWYITRDFDPTVDTVQGLMTENLLYVDITRCSELADDFEGWRMKNGKEVHDESSHGPAALRYDLGNVAVIERRREREHGKAEQLPAVRERGVDSVDRAGLLGAVGSQSQQVETEAWRRSMGMMTTNPGVDGWRQ